MEVGLVGLVGVCFGVQLHIVLFIMSNGIQRTFALEEPVALGTLRFFIVGAEDGGKFKFVSGTKSVF